MTPNRLIYTHRIRLTEDDHKLLADLKKMKVRPSVFIRQALREKLQRDMPSIIKAEQERKQKEYCPF